MKKILGSFLVLLSTIYGQRKEIELGQSIEIKKSKVLSYKISEFPAYSNLYYAEKKGATFTFTPDVVGVYKVEVDFGSDKEYIDILVKSNDTYNDYEIYNIIEGSIKDGNVPLLEKKLNVLFKNNPQDINIKVYLKRYIDYLLDKNMREEAFGIYKILNANYKLLNSENFEILLKIYENESEKGLLDLEVLKLLSYFDNKYTYVLAKESLRLGKNTQKALLLVQSRYDNLFDKEAAKILAEYYINNGEFNKSEKYLKMTNRVLLAEEYYKLGNRSGFDFLYKKLREEEKAEVDNYVKVVEEEKTIKLYYEKALLSMQNQRYEIADIYFKRVIRLTIDGKLRKKAIFNIGKMYLDEKKYNEGLLVFERYLKEYGSVVDAEARYSLGVLYYNLKKFTESDKMFNQIVSLYPDTVWATRASIYKLKLNDKGDNNES